MSREVLFRHEFDNALCDPLNRLWVVWDGDRPVAMALIATEVTATRYLSRAYFERHYPDRFARGEVHYVMWAVIDQHHVATEAVGLLARGGLALEAADGALLVFDVPEVNQRSERGGAAALLIRLAHLVGEATLVPLGVQRYFAVDFDRARDQSDVMPEVDEAEILAALPSAGG